VQTLDGKVFDVAEMAECVFFGAIDCERYELSLDQFEAAYQNFPKTLLKFIDNRAKDDGFLQASVIHSFQMIPKASENARFSRRSS